MPCASDTVIVIHMDPDRSTTSYRNLEKGKWIAIMDLCFIEGCVVC